MPSMGPPPFGDGNYAGEVKMIALSDAFNGATAFRRWKHLLVDHLRRRFVEKRTFSFETAVKRAVTLRRINLGSLFCFWEAARGAA